jgi:hypothetical protein
MNGQQMLAQIGAGRLLAAAQALRPARLQRAVFEGVDGRSPVSPVLR